MGRSKRREQVGVVLAVTLFVALWLAPLPLEQAPHRLLAIFAAVVMLWITEAIPIPVTALLIAPALIGAGITSSKVAFAPYADPLLFLFVGGFFIARAMQRHGLDRRFAQALLSAKRVRGAGKNTNARVRVAFMVAGALLSMWISNTATTAILAPILLGGFGADEDAEGPLLGIAYACSVGGLGTLVGSPPNGITARLLSERLAQDGVDFGFVEWAMIGLPAALVLLVVVIVVTLRRHPPSPSKATASAQKLDIEKLQPKPWSRGEKLTALSLGLAITGWTVTGLWKASGSAMGASVASALPGGAIALIACVPLFVAHDEKETRILPWNDAVRIDWGIILLFGGGIALGTQMFETGLARALAEGFVALSGIEGVWTLTAVVTLFTILFTETCSNTASATMLVPLVIAIADELGVSPVAPALGVGLAASCAFALPIATGPNAIAFGTGRVSLRAMMRTGLVLNVACAIAIWILIRILVPAFGWG